MESKPSETPKATRRHVLKAAGEKLARAYFGLSHYAPFATGMVLSGIFFEFLALHITVCLALPLALLMGLLVTGLGILIIFGSGLHVHSLEVLCTIFLVWLFVYGLPKIQKVYRATKYEIYKSQQRAIIPAGTPPAR